MSTVFETGVEVSSRKRRDGEFDYLAKGRECDQLLFADMRLTGIAPAVAREMNFAAEKPETSQALAGESTSSDIVLETLKATIYEVDETLVRLKLAESVFASFPKSLFSGMEGAVRYGQPILYSIRRAPNGLRYQHFEVDTSPVENPYKKQVMAILDSIKP